MDQKKNTVTSVHEVVKRIIIIWGSGKIKVKKNFKFYEQKNLQLNITKAEKILRWTPIYTISQSIKTTVDWYKNVHIKKILPEKVTKDQILEYFKNVNKS